MTPKKGLLIAILCSGVSRYGNTTAINKTNYALFLGKTQPLYLYFSTTSRISAVVTLLPLLACCFRLSIASSPN